MENKPLLKVVGISKKFGAVQALCDVSFEVDKGEVLGLLGDNGAGKSTLIKIISGVYPPDKGEIFFEGKRIERYDPAYARSLGIETVYQDLALAAKRNIAENIFLGREYLKAFLGTPIRVLDKRRMEKEAKLLLQRLRIDIDPRSKVGNLSGGQRQATAIARSVFWNAKLVIMDEPTAALGISEREKVHQIISELKNHNISVILISHNLEDTINVADKAVILRLGKKVGECLLQETSKDELARLIVAG